MQVLVDTREQSPIPFRGAISRTLNVGDYTTEALQKKFVIERKSPNDLYQSILKGHMRFRRLLQRAKDKRIRVVMFIECEERVFTGKLYRGAKYQRHPSHILCKIIATLQTKYKLEFVWCKDRITMKTKMLKRLRFEEGKL